MRYIDADIAIYEIDKLQGSLMSSNDALWKKNKMIYKGLCNARGIIDDIPTADVVPKSEAVAEVFEKIEKRIAMYSHLHEYADEAREITEEYADGTPCELTSVWEVLSLHKNGWDDYETMNKLQDNIGNIEKSRLLKEFEEDIAELKKQYIGG